MKAGDFIDYVMNAIIRILGVAGFILSCSIPAHAGDSKAFDKYDPPSDLILTLPDQWPTTEKVNQSINRSEAVHNNSENQTSALQRVPINMDCDINVVQNTAGDVPLSNRFFGECGLHYHY